MKLGPGEHGLHQVGALRRARRDHPRDVRERARPERVGENPVHGLHRVVAPPAAAEVANDARERRCSGQNPCNGRAQIGAF